MTPEASPSFAAQLAGTAAALVGVLVLAWLGLRLLKRLHDRQADAGDAPPLQVLRSVAVGPRERLVVVRWRDRELLLGVTGGGITRLDPPAVDPSCGRP
jgi:flagellar protein FliO/FliZ